MGDIFNKSRNDVKLIFLITLFSSNNNHSVYKKLFKNLYPTIFNWMFQFKLLNGYKNLSIMLQRLESHIMIDIVYRVFKNVRVNHQRIVCFTKHDSIIVQQSNYQTVRTKIFCLLTSINFNCCLK